MEVNNVNTLKKVYSLKEAYGQVPKVYTVEVREKIRAIIGTKRVDNVYGYLDGTREPKISHAIALNILFANYGIEIQWGKTPPEAD